MHGKNVSKRAVLTIFLIIAYTIVAAKVYSGGTSYLRVYYNIVDRQEPDLPLKNVVVAVAGAENLGYIKVQGDIEMSQIDSAALPKVGDALVIIQNGQWSSNKTDTLLSPEKVLCMVKNSSFAEVEGVALYWYVPGQGWVKVILAEDISLHGASDIKKCLGTLPSGLDDKNFLGYSDTRPKGETGISLHLVGKGD